MGVVRKVAGQSAELCGSYWLSGLLHSLGHSSTVYFCVWFMRVFYGQCIYVLHIIALHHFSRTLDSSLVHPLHPSVHPRRLPPSPTRITWKIRMHVLSPMRQTPLHVERRLVVRGEGEEEMLSLSFTITAAITT